MTDILLAEDQTLVRQGLKLMIEIDEKFQVTGEASNGKEAIALCEKQSFDVVILDIRMPEMNGLEAGRKIRERWPEVIILMLTTFNDEEYALEALKYKANGYLLKDGDAEVLNRSIKSALAGGLVIEDHVAAKVMPALMKDQTEKLEINESLTKRELDIIACIGQGMNNQEIAAKLFLSVGTVKNQISIILDKLNLRDRTQIAIYSLEHDLKR
ncbi:response regulator transcription factor [Tetragenococcus koreensis]|uniref:Response regulator transcription factor n=1 Tax=Tetragenococcus solitarius TaxID=71453 RepID=A0ABN3Y3U8_9ENTE|nr:MULTISPECIES: response regulator transcription factor [Tetragenococcus]MDN6640872.1 response regulator transcription factor [Tetragenococcus sp.]MCF1584424.1 response regulator transcription factor [Tetragenococcus koreensis]MCF1613973.1 response regulator transcription factor [Tetragenococcus koreensis]MCF1619812.1 response regulator transcription factor [Tetragenococcus koreensis]MCF1623741.1 response regulator transcription factor [Tetragenococcus koreensis]